MSNQDFTINKSILKRYKGTDGDVVIPDGVTCIDRRAFYHCEKLKSVTIPDSVTHIRTDAFCFAKI